MPPRATRGLKARENHQEPASEPLVLKEAAAPVAPATPAPESRAAPSPEREKENGRLAQGAAAVARVFARKPKPKPAPPPDAAAAEAPAAAAEAEPALGAATEAAAGAAEPGAAEAALKCSAAAPAPSAPTSATSAAALSAPAAPGGPRGARARKAASAAARALADAARAALLRSSAYFAEVDSERLVEEAEGEPAPPAPAEAESLSLLDRAFSAAADAAARAQAAAARAAARVSAAATPGSPGGGTPSRVAARTGAWVSSLGASAGRRPAAVAEEEAPEIAEWTSPSSPSASASEEAAAAAAPPRPSLAPARPSLGLSRRASLGFAPPPPRRSSLAPLAETRASLAPGRPSFRRISLADPGRRGSLEAAAGGRAPPPPPAAAGAAAIAEEEEEEAAILAELEADGDADVAEAAAAAAEASVEDDLGPLYSEDEEEEAEAAEGAALAALSPLAALLAACGQRPDDVLSMAEALHPWMADPAAARKCGEGTFGEAFMADGGPGGSLGGGRGVVLKVMPICGDALVNGAEQRDAVAIRAEVVMHQQLSQLRCGLEEGGGGEDAGKAARANATACFVRTAACIVARGPYAPPLLRAWRRYEEDKGTENDFPGTLPEHQLYAVFVLEHGGSDLESFELRSGAEARALLLQTALTLAVAEEALQFEHRDLHWGNVLLSRPPAEAASESERHVLRGVPFAAAREGLRVTIIDFTLSRMTPRGGAAIFSDLEADPELFLGAKGEAQFETYRKERKAVKADWSRFQPATNALWLAYLADTLLSKKAVPMSREERGALRAFRGRAAKYGRASDAVLDDLFAGMWAHAEA